ncbi:MAG: hypothetical protein KKA81_05725 [Bacteroidetes bacterium]|nr:hypothetical protein [Bacteroidota bacterium]
MKVSSPFCRQFFLLLAPLFLTIFVLSFTTQAQYWYYSDVDSIPPGYNGNVIGTGMAFDQDGYPHIFNYHPRLFGSKLHHTWWDGFGWQDEELVGVGTGGINTGPGVAIDPENHIHVAFRNDQYGISYGFFDGEWQYETVDATTNSASWLRFTIDSQNRPHIAYTGVDQGELRYAFKDNGNWNVEVFPGGFGTVGSIVTDQLDNPHILSSMAYSIYRYFNGTEWIVEDNLPFSMDSYLVLDENQQPHVSFYYTGEGLYDLRYAYKNAGEWVFSVVDPGTQQNKIGWDNIIRIDQEGVFHIVYFAHNAGLVKHAWGSDDAWNTEIIDYIDIWNPAIDFIIDNNLLYISYHDNIEGWLRLASSDPVVGLHDIKGIHDKSYMQIKPNPFRGKTNIDAFLENEGIISLDVYNSTGEHILCLASENLSAGRHSFTWDANGMDGRNLPAGLYLLIMRHSSGQESAKAIIF